MRRTAAVNVPAVSDSEGSTARPRGIPLSSFLTCLIWLCVLPLLILAAWLAVDNVLRGRADRDREAANLARNVAATIDQSLDARIAALRMLAASPLLDDASRWSDFYQEAQGFHQSFGTHVILADVGTPMRMLLNTRVPYGSALPVLPRPVGRAAAPTALATRSPAVGDLVIGPVAKKPLIAIAVPVLRGDKPVFVVLSTFETGLFLQLLDQVALPRGLSLALLDSQGEAIARRAPPGLDPERYVDPAGRFVAQCKAAPWSVVLEIPRDVYRAPLISAAIALGAGLLGATLIGVLGTTLASRWLGRALAALVEPPLPDAPHPRIAEILAVRRLLDEAAARRERARIALQQTDELRRQSHALQALIDNLPHMAWLKDREGRFVAVNRVVAEINGLKVEPQDLFAALLQWLPQGERPKDPLPKSAAERSTRH